MPTRCSGCSPSDSSPAAYRETCSPASAHVTEVQRSPSGYRNASRRGLRSTRSRNWSATLSTMRSTKLVSVLAGTWDSWGIGVEASEVVVNLVEEVTHG